MALWVLVGLVIGGQASGCSAGPWSGAWYAWPVRETSVASVHRVHVEAVVARQRIRWLQDYQPVAVPCGTCAGGYRYDGTVGRWGKLGDRWVCEFAKDGRIIGYLVDDRSMTPDEFYVRFPAADERVQQQAKSGRWVLSAGSCGMLGCRIHGGGWTRVEE